MKRGSNGFHSTGAKMIIKIRVIIIIIATRVVINMTAQTREIVIVIMHVLSSNQQANDNRQKSTKKIV